MKIASWNVNSVRTRLTHITDWLCSADIDILLLQETKCTDDVFPQETFFDLGYNVVCLGQKTYNGVAILSKSPIEDIHYNLPNFNDPQARYIDVFTAGLRIASVYVPNGSEVGSDKYAYKLSFLDALYERLKQVLSFKEKVVIGGDFNIAPQDIDVYDPNLWSDDTILCSVEERVRFRHLLNLGYCDALRTLLPHERLFTWWDYRDQSFKKNNGIRIDHFLVSPEAMDQVSMCGVDTNPRKAEKPSDHAPIVLTLV